MTCLSIRMKSKINNFNQEIKMSVEKVIIYSLFKFCIMFRFLKNKLNLFELIFFRANHCVTDADGHDS
jgi:hypothetical protein